MKLFKNFEFSTGKILKIIGIAFAAIIIFVIFFRLIISSFDSLSFKRQSIPRPYQEMSAPAVLGGAGMIKEDVYYEEANDYDGASVGLSARNVAPEPEPPIVDDITRGNAEEFEVIEYSANIETRDLENSCNKIISLKSREEIIFENANEDNESCVYNFKVKHDNVPEILSIIEGLNPREINENTYTIKNLIDDYTSETEILKNKLASVEETLNDAIDAYDEITVLATRTQDVENLAKIIDSKIRIIKNLTQEKINIITRLERLERSKLEQLDRLEYTYFDVLIYENKFVDGQDLKDSWKSEIKFFVADINTIAQDITINLVSLAFLLLQYIVYLFIILIVVKYSWKLAKYIWKR